MNGLKNHFIFVDGRKIPFRPSQSEIQKLCDLTTSVGADELIVFEEPSQKDQADFLMRIYNPDGSEVETCINATRCAAWLYFEEKQIHQAKIETLGGILDCYRESDFSVGINIGKPLLKWDQIPLAKPMDTLDLKLSQGQLKGGTAVNFGNPHCVFFVEDIDRIDLAQDALPLYSHPIFPNQCNIEVADIQSPTFIRMKVVERPGIFTMACGSGACATYVAAKRKQLISATKITLQMPAGEVEIEEKANGDIFLTGSVEYGFSGYFPLLSP